MGFPFFNLFQQDSKKDKSEGVVRELAHLSLLISPPFLLRLQNGGDSADIP